VSAEILVVDDDDHLREVVRYALAREGFTVREAATGRQALDALRERPADLVVLDVMMPDLDGLQTVRRLREADDPVPVVFLSSRAEELDRVLGLELGGDDYLTKPFSPRELVSRVKAVLRRTARPAAEADALLAGPIRVDLGAHRCFVDEAEVELTGTELRLLAALVGARGRLLSRHALVSAAYDGPHHVSDRTVDSHVRNLRAKLRAAGVDPIETVHGSGFRLAP
jgi:two-component system OmpR family response regulator